jgi:hypothetical protein
MKLLLALILLTSQCLAADWTPISEAVTAQVKPGYAGPTAGVVVDHATGAVFMVVNDQGLWRSTDHGANFIRCDGGTIGGRCETGWALQADPAGKRLACFMIYGSSAMTTDGGETWTKFKTTHFDCGSVDWADTGKRLLAIRHESGGLLTASEDGGATWKDLEKGFASVGVFDHSTFVVTKEKEPGIFRSTDAGASWTQISDAKPTALAPIIVEGTAYWPTGKTLLVSRDRGATWSELGPGIDVTHGPLLSNDTTRLIFVGKTGFSETSDGGKTWKSAAPLPPGFTVNRVGPNYAWDARANMLYASTMSKPTLRLELGK